jgi:hypothetical protein
VVGDERECEAAVLGRLRLIHQLIRLPFLAREGVAELDIPRTSRRRQFIKDNARA